MKNGTSIQRMAALAMVAVLGTSQALAQPGPTPATCPKGGPSVTIKARMGRSTSWSGKRPEEFRELMVTGPKERAKADCTTFIRFEEQWGPKYGFATGVFRECHEDLLPPIDQLRSGEIALVEEGQPEIWFFLFLFGANPKCGVMPSGKNAFSRRMIRPFKNFKACQKALARRRAEIAAQETFWALNNAWKELSPARQAQLEASYPCDLDKKYGERCADLRSQLARSVRACKERPDSNTCLKKGECRKQARACEQGVRNRYRACMKKRLGSLESLKRPQRSP